MKISNFYLCPNVRIIFYIVRDFGTLTLRESEFASGICLVLTQHKTCVPTGDAILKTGT